MNNLMKILFAVAVIIFISGVIWAITSTVRLAKDKDKPEPVPPVTTQPTPTPPAATPSTDETTPLPATTSAPEARSVSRPARKPVVRRTIIQSAPVVEMTNDFSANAWARSGVNPDGSTYAETGVN